MGWIGIGRYALDMDGVCDAESVIVLDEDGQSGNFAASAVDRCVREGSSLGRRYVRACGGGGVV